MAERYFNWKLALVLLISITALCITAFGLRQWQMSTRAGEGLRLGNEAFEAKNWEEAITQLGRYVGARRDDVGALLKYAEAHLNIRPTKGTNIKQAIGAYRTVLREDPNNTEAVIQLAHLYLDVTDTAGEAELITSRYLDRSSNTQVQMSLASALKAQRKFNEAAGQLKAIIDQDPTQIEAYEMLGQLAEQQPDVLSAPASQWYDKAVQDNPSSPLAYIARADYRLRHSDRAGATQDLTQAGTLESQDATVNIRLAVSLWNAGHPDQAEAQLERAEDIDPANAALWLTWAQLAFASGSKEKMIRVAQTGLEELAAQPWDFMPTAAELFLRAADVESAKDCVARLQKKEANPGAAAYLNGLIADLEGKTNEAAKYWNRALELGNDSPPVRLALSSVCARMGDVPTAMRQLRIIIGRAPNYVPGRLALAKLLIHMNDWSGALEQARTILTLAPDNYEAARLEFQAMMRLQAGGNNTDSPNWNDLQQKLTSLQQQSPDSIEVKMLSLNMALLRKDLSDAGAVVDSIKTSHPADPRTAGAEAQFLVAQDRPAEAIEALRLALEKFPQAADLPVFLASLLQQQGDRQQCEAVLLRAMETVEDKAARRDLGLILAEYYRRWDELNDAFALLKNLSQAAPQDVSLKRRLLRCRQTIENPAETQKLVDQIRSIEGPDGWRWRYEQARAWFVSDDFAARRPNIISLLKENIQANPDDQESRLLLAATYDRSSQLQLETYDRNSQLQAAISAYREAHNRSPDDLRIIAGVVSALYRAMEWDQADEILNKAAERKLDDSTLDRLQLEGYLRRGQLDSASSVLQDFVTMDPNDISAGLALALLDMRQNKYDEAGKLLESLRAKDPNSLHVIVAQIQLHVYQGKTEDALQLCNEVISEQNDASAYMLRARTYASLGQFDKAEADLVHAVNLEPKNIQAWKEKSNIHQLANQTTQAIDAAQHALTLDPNDEMVQRLAISLMLASRDSAEIEQAHSLLRSALQKNPDNNTFKLLQVQSLLLEQTTEATDRAVVILRSITDAQPALTEAWAMLGEIELGRGKPGNAMDIALQGLVHNQNNRSLLMIKARAEQSRSPILSIPTYRHLLTLDPNDLDAALRLADVYVAVGNPQKSEELVRSFLSHIENARDRQQFSVALAVAMYKSGRSSQAKQEIEAVLEQVPGDANTLAMISNAIAGTRHPEAEQLAENLLRTAVAEDPNSPLAILSLAALLQLNDRSSEAIGLYEQVLAMKLDNSLVAIAANNLAWILCEDTNEPEKALELTQKGLQIAPHYVDLIDTRGVVYYRMGRFDKAAEDFRECLRRRTGMTSGVAALHFHLGRALSKLDSKDEALRHINQALRPANPADSLSPEDANEAKALVYQLSE